MVKPTEDQQCAMDQLKALLPEGKIVYTILRHVSQSGMLRAISPVIVDASGDPFDIGYLVKRAGLGKLHGKGGIKMTGVGMDMGFYLVYSLSQAIHGDGYALGQRWL